VITPSLSQYLQMNKLLPLLLRHCRETNRRSIDISIYLTMEYTESYIKLKEVWALRRPKIKFDGTIIQKFNFHSGSTSILPGAGEHWCDQHQVMLSDDFSFSNDIGISEEVIHVKDALVQENKDFDYYVIKPDDGKPSKKVIFLIHGFNEKNWEKYLPWGKAICDRTRSAVVFYPIAFHMQRAPLQWSEKRKMYELSEVRKQKFPNIVHSTLSNVAISMRLHYMPQRFIWSGLQSYYDVIRCIGDFRKGNIEAIDPGCAINIFAYSIGGLLAEILKLTNYEGIFSHSKIGLFCSGAVFNRLSPVSKFILDSEANVALYSFLVEHFDSFLKKDPFLHHFIDEDHLEGKVFHSMLDYQKMRNFREDLLRKSEKDIYAISLAQDLVIPSFEIINTLQGAYKDIHIAVDEMDFDYPYTHENPFPVYPSHPQETDATFNTVFDKVGDFFNQE